MVLSESVSCTGKSTFPTRGAPRRTAGDGDEQARGRVDGDGDVPRAVVAHQDDVIVETDRGWVKMKADVSERSMEGVVLVPHGWEGEANCNRLTDAQCREPIMGYPQWKGLLCTIRKAQ